ncbi:DUF2490 domain-containing protein [Novosphingobium bradum]|uniref:DUF2490 domain-containing protein n=1 Tax=Novosphingobium bradum TaxID=1737444 RepID=A0ABV7ISI6_9SPHN
MRMTACLALTTAAAALATATPALADDTQAWGTVTLNAGLGGPLKASSETVLRTSDAKGFYEVEQNLMLGYKANKHVTYWLGYTLDPQYTHGNLTITEHRFRQQVSFDNIAKIGPVNVNARLRLEERWRDGLAGTGWRLRPYVKLSLPIHGKTNLNLTHESFINLNTTGFQKVSGYDRWRTGVSISTPVAKNISVDLGYLNQHGFVRSGPDTDDHVATLGLTASF